MIKSSDTYVLVIAVSVLPILQDLGVEELLVAFGQGQKTQSYARKTKEKALASAMAFSHAATLRNLLATLSNWRKYCPRRFAPSHLASSNATT
jgi:hypothetical protein